MKTIAIIGAGLSGTLTAIQLLKSQRKDIAQIILIEKTGKSRCRGVAYSNDFEYQPLNVRARNMSLFSDDEGHFLRWLQINKFKYSPERLPSSEAFAFVRRDIFGDYLTDTFEKLSEKTAIKTTFWEDEIVDVLPNWEQFHLLTQRGQRIIADSLVLAFGNFPPAELLAGRPFFQNPWLPDSLRNIRPNEDVLLVGTGLTMVDVACSLHQRGHRGKIIALSRRGYLPLPHANPPDCPLPLPPLPESRRAADLLNYLKKCTRKTEQEGYSWQSVFDRFRPQTQRVWREMPIEEKRVFLRHLRVFWDIHRHRMPMQSAQILEKMQQSGQLEIRAGRIRNAATMDGRLQVVWQPKGKNKVESLPPVDVSLNCTGPDANLEKLPSLLIRQLLRRNLIAPDELRLGARASETGQLLDARNQTVGNIFAIGTLRKSTLWESTALKEIREQSEILAKNI